MAAVDVLGNGIASTVAFGTLYANMANEIVDVAGGGIGSTVALGDPAVIDPALTTFITLNTDFSLKSLQGPHGKVDFRSGHPYMRASVIATGDAASPRASSLATSEFVGDASDILFTGLVTAADLSSVTTFALNSLASNYEVKYHSDVNHAADEGSITLTPELTMGATLSPSFSFHYTEVGVRIKAFGDAADCRLMYPQPTHTVTGWPAAATTEQRSSLLGLQLTGGASALVDPPSGFAFNELDEPSAGIAAGVTGFYQSMYFWNHVTKEGVLLRVTDKVHQGKVLVAWRDAGTDDLIVALRMPPQANVTGIANASDGKFDYGLEIRPMTGDWYDAVKYVKSRMIAEGHPSMAKGRIKDRSDFPDRIKNAAIFGAITSPAGVFPDVADWYALYTESTNNIVSSLQMDPKTLVMSLYNYWDGTMGGKWPVMDWQDGAIDMVTAMYDADITTLLYQVPALLAEWDGTDGLNPSLGINNDLQLARDGNPVTAEAPAESAALIGPVFEHFYTENEANIRALYELLLDQVISGVGTKFHGLYDDGANGAAPLPGENPSLPAVSRGYGSKTWMPGNRARMDLWREVMEEKGITDPIVFSEHANETLIGHVDFIFDNNVGPVEGTFNSILPTVSLLWSDYSVIANFSSYGDGPADGEFDFLDIPGFATKYESFTALYANYFHRGQIPSLLRYFSNNQNVYFPTGLSSGYAAWRDFLHTMLIKQLPLINHYRQSERIRELPSSHVHAHIEAVITGDATPLMEESTKASTSVWYDSDDDVIAVLITNWSLSGHHPYAAAFRDTMTIADFPELGNAPRTVKLLNFETDEVVLLPAYDGSGSYTIDTQTSPGQVYAIELALTSAGPSAGLIGAVNTVPKNLLVVWTDDMNDTLDNYGVLKGPGGTVTVTVKSAFYLDTTVFNDTTSMSAATYTITANQTTLHQSSKTTIAAPGRIMTKWPVAVDSICMISGNVSSVGASAGDRAVIRVSPSPDVPLNSDMSTLFSSIEVTARANYAGDFVIPAPRGSLIRISCPNAGYHVNAVIPDQENANLGDLETIRIDPFTNN